MKVKSAIWLALALGMGGLQAQVGIGTENPRGAVDINSPTTNIWGLVLPTNADTGNISNPAGGVALGTIIYDSALDCVRVYKSDGWSGCIGDSSGSSGSGSGSFFWASNLRFSQISADRSGFTVGLATDGTVWEWGSNTYTYGTALYTPRKVQNTPANIVKVQCQNAGSGGNTGGALLLTAEGDLYTWGNIGLAGGTYETPQKVTGLPAGVTKVVDAAIGPAGPNMGLMIIGDDGNIYQIGYYTYFTGSNYSWASTTTWLKWNKPAGEPEAFKYTRLMNSTNAVFQLFYVEGTSDNGASYSYYATGHNYFTNPFGAASSPTNNIGTAGSPVYKYFDPVTSASNIYKIALPAGTVLKKIVSSGFYSAMALTTSGQAYAWGYQSIGITGAAPSYSPADPSGIESGLTGGGYTFYFYRTPKLLNLPPGASSFKDISETTVTSYGSTFSYVDNNGKVWMFPITYYTLGGFPAKGDTADITTANTNQVYSSDEDYTTYKEGLGFTYSGIKVKALEGIYNDNPSNWFLDENGQVWIVQFVRGNYLGTGYFIRGASSTYIGFPIPLASGQYDPANPNPEP